MFMRLEMALGQLTLKPLINERSCSRAESQVRIAEAKVGMVLQAENVLMRAYVSRR